jgi:Glycosyltransferase family 87
LLPYVGPAAALPLYGALARLPFALAVRIWTALLVLAFIVLALCAAALAPRTRFVAAAAGAVLFAYGSGAVISALALGQVALLSAAGIAGALVAYACRATLAGAFATLVAGLQPNLALGLIARMRDRTALVSAALGALAFAVLTLAAGRGIDGFIEYLRVLREHGNAERFVVIQHTPAALAYAFGAPENVASAVGIACALAALAAVVAVTFAARLGARDGALLALAALPLAVPFFHEHDFVVELIPLIVLAALTRGAARAWSGIAAALLLVDWLDLAQRPAADGQIVALGLAVAFAFVALGPGVRATRADLAPFAAVIVLACCTVPLARAFPAPTWPDMLPSGYRAPATADASAEWFDEQRAAGLDARSAAWGALRALPLTGCMLLAFCIITTTSAQRSKAARL